MDTREFQVETDQLSSESEEPVEDGPGPTPLSAGESGGGEPPRQDEMESALTQLTSGQIVEGLIVHIDQGGALVDVGTKSEGHVSREDLGGAITDDGRPLEVGDRISVYVVRPEDEEGSPVLSKKRADYERVWHRITEAHEKGEVLSAMVTDRVKGGLVVDLGLRGFLPASHVRTRNVHALDRFVGQSVKVKILEVDRARKRVVVSHKEAVEEERQKRREKTLETLEENKIHRGVVRRITDYGAFVDLGGVDGLLHVTEMSWTRIEHPKDVVKVGERIDVMVLRYDREQNRISLGLKQILPDPWEEVTSTYRVGQVIDGVVTRVVPFGAFVKLQDTGIEAIIPNAELSGDRGKRAADVLQHGQSVQAKIVNIRASERRMTLSLREFEQARDRQQLKDYMQRQDDASRVTIGDLFGSVLAEAAGPSEPEPDETGEAPAGGGEAEPDEGDPKDEEAVPSPDSETSESSESPAESEAERD